MGLSLCLGLLLGFGQRLGGAAWGERLALRASALTFLVAWLLSVAHVQLWHGAVGNPSANCITKAPAPSTKTSSTLPTFVRTSKSTSGTSTTVNASSPTPSKANVARA